MDVRSWVFSLTVAGALLTTAALAQGTPPTPSTVMAEVNGQPVTYGQLVARLLDAQGEVTLEALVNRAIVAQAAAREHVTITNAEIDQRVAEFKKLLGGPDPARA